MGKKLQKKIQKRNPVAQSLSSNQFRQRVIPNKKKNPNQKHKKKI